MKFLNYEIKRFTNTAVPPSETKTKSFSWVTTPTRIEIADVSKYRSAAIAAKGQYIQERGNLYDFYQTALDFDAHLNGLIDRRLLATSGRKIEYSINGDPVESVNELIDSPMFDRMIRDYIMSTMFWGMGLFDFGKDGRWIDYTLIPIKHIDPFEKKVRRTQYGTSDQDKSYDKIKTAIFVGEPDNFGMFQQLALLALQKRAAINDWSTYCQLAGTNFRVIKYKGAAPDPARMQTELERISKASNGALGYAQAEMDVVTENQTSSSQNEVFRDITTYFDEQMTKLVLGQTMTTEDGSSRSQAEVHERTQESIFDADAKSFLNFMNYQFYDIQEMYGIPSGGRWQFVESGTLKQNQELERDLKLSELISIDPEYFYEKYELPRPAEVTSGNLAAVIGVGGIQAMQSIIADPNLSPEQKMNILQIVFGITEEDARRMALPTQ